MRDSQSLYADAIRFFARHSFPGVSPDRLSEARPGKQALHAACWRALINGQCRILITKYAKVISNHWGI